MNLFSFKNIYSNKNRPVRNSFIRLFFSAFDFFPSRQICIRWYQSLRKGKFIFSLPENLVVDKICPPENEIDFLIYVLLPVSNQKYSADNLPCIKDERILFWIPDDMDSNLYGEYINNFNNKKCNTHFQNVLKEIYNNGIIKSAENKYINLSSKNIYNLFENILKNNFRKAYYKYPIIRNLDSLSVQEIFNYFSCYKIESDFEKLMNAGETYSLYNDIYFQLRSRPYGICALTFKYLIMYMYFKNKCELLTGRKRILFIEKKDKVYLDKRFSGIKYISPKNLIPKHQWERCLKLKNKIKIFDIEISEELNNYNQNFFWEKLVEIIKDYNLRIKKNLRSLCSVLFYINKKSQIPVVFNIFVRSRHILDSYIYMSSQNSYLGLLKFFDMINELYDSFNTFLFELEIISGLSEHENDITEFKNSYDYLSKIVLPGNKKNEISKLLTKLNNQLNNIHSLICNSNKFKEYREMYKKFKDLYIENYLKEHHIYYKKMAIFKDKLFSLTEYKILDELINIPEFDFSNKDVFNTFFQKKCNCKNLRKILTKKPCCPCGFSLGNKFTEPALEKIKPLLIKKTCTFINKIMKNREYEQVIANYCRENPKAAVNHLFTPGNKKFTVSLTVKIVKELKYIFNS